MPHAATAARARMVRRIAWTIVWIALGAWSLHFLWSVYGKYHAPSPETYTMFWSRRGWLWTHLAGGTLTILLGPLQFMTRWPRAYPRLHRWSGRVFIMAMLVASGGAIGLIATSPAPFTIRSAFAATALAWLGTALVAMLAIHRGQVQRHRRWMVRNYLVTLSPITFRVLLHAGIALGLAPSPGLIAILLWLSWALPLLGNEVVLRVLGLRNALPRQAGERSGLMGETSA